MSSNMLAHIKCMWEGYSTNSVYNIIFNTELINYKGLKIFLVLHVLYGAVILIHLPIRFVRCFNHPVCGGALPIQFVVVALYPSSLWWRSTHPVCGAALPIQFVVALYPSSLWWSFTHPVCGGGALPIQFVVELYPSSLWWWRFTHPVCGDALPTQLWICTPWVFFFFFFFFFKASRLVLRYYNTNSC